MRFKHGLVIGKFLPVHNGHCYLIDMAQNSTQTLSVLLCSLPSEAIRGALRVTWLKALYPQITLYHITTADKDAQRDKPHAVQIWAETIRNTITDAVDAVYSSEAYGYALARHLNATHIAVDRKRAVVPISGSVILSHPHKYHHYLPPLVQRYFLRRIVIATSNADRDRHIAQRLAKIYRACFVRSASSHRVPMRQDGMHTHAVPAYGERANLIRNAHRIVFYPYAAFLETDMRREYFYKPLCICVTGAEEASILADTVDLYRISRGFFEVRAIAHINRILRTKTAS